MSVLVTGATGFVGAVVARRLIEKGEDVHVLARNGASFWRLEDLQGRFTIHEGDLNDAEAVARVATAVKPSVIYHLAAYGAYHDQKDAARILETTILGTWNVLRAAMDANVGLVVNAGSSSEYGTKDHPMKEDEVLDPNSIYAVGKAAQTHLCRHLAKTKQLATITLRIFGAYGPYEDPERFMPTLIDRALRGEDIPLSAPETPRDFIYIDDVVDAFLAAGAHPELSGEVINVGTGRQSNLREAVETVLALTGSSSSPKWNTYPARPFDPTVWVADNTRLRTTLGVTPRTDLRSGLEKQIAWQRTHAHLAKTHVA